jgi:hypothetical protein
MLRVVFNFRGVDCVHCNHIQYFFFICEAVQMKIEYVTRLDQYFAAFCYQRSFFIKKVDWTERDIHFGSWVYMNPLCENTFWNIKKIWNKIAHEHLDILCSHTNFREKGTFFVSRVKKKKINVQNITIHRTFFCLFCINHIKYSFPPKTCGPYVHVKFYLRIF